MGRERHRRGGQGTGTFQCSPFKFIFILAYKMAKRGKNIYKVLGYVPKDLVYPNIRPSLNLI